MTAVITSSTLRKLDLIAHAKVWYMDGTFRVVDDPWKQLFYIHAFIKSGSTMKQIPLAFCIMSGKRTEDYYESAYNLRDDVNRFLRQLMASPFLPPEHISDTLHQLDQRAPPALVPIMDYVYNTWINSSVFDIQNWRVFMTSVRTDNDVEGWHNRFNSNVVTRGAVPFYHLITELFAEALDIPLQLKLVSEGKMSRHKRKKSKEVQSQVFSFWTQYAERSISASQLLRECAFVYGPPAE